MAVESISRPPATRNSRGASFFGIVIDPLGLFGSFSRKTSRKGENSSHLQRQPTAAEISAATAMQATLRGRAARRAVRSEAEARVACEDARIAAALGVQLAASDFPAVFLRVQEFKRQLLAMRVIQRRSRAALRRRGEASGALSVGSSSSDHLPGREGEILGGISLLAQRLAFAGLEQETMADDGNCQFRALSYQLFGSQERHGHVRSVAVNHMRSRPEKFGVFFFGEGEFGEFLTHMACPRTWCAHCAPSPPPAPPPPPTPPTLTPPPPTPHPTTASIHTASIHRGDELTLRAAADAFGCTVHVTTTDRENWHLLYEGGGDAGARTSAAEPRKLFLTYISPVHYNAVHRSDAASLKVAAAH